jgi:hypothetical protein
MSRKKRKISKDEVDHLYRKCRYCQAHRGARFFDRHEAACKARWIIQNETHQLSQSTTTIENASAIQPHNHLPGNFVEGSSVMRLEDIVEEADQLDVSEASRASAVKEPNLSE